MAAQQIYFIIADHAMSTKNAVSICKSVNCTKTVQGFYELFHLENWKKSRYDIDTKR